MKRNFRKIRRIGFYLKVLFSFNLIFSFQSLSIFYTDFHSFIFSYIPFYSLTRDMELCTINYLPINEIVLQMKFRNFILSFLFSLSVSVKTCVFVNEWHIRLKSAFLGIPVNIWIFLQKMSICFSFFSKKKFNFSRQISVCIVSKSVNRQTSCFETTVHLTQCEILHINAARITMRQFRWRRRRKVIFKIYNLYSQRNSYLNKRFFCFVRKV